MRVFVFAAMLLASSTLCSFAQEPGKAPAAAPQAGAPAQTDQNAPPPPDQKAGREQQKSDNREMGPDWKMRRSDGDRTGRDDREMGHGGMMHRGDGDRMGRDDRDTGHGGMMRRGDGDRMGRDDRDTGHGGMMRRSDGDRMGYDRDKDRGRYHERGERYWDDADRDRTYRGYADADRPRRRVKICVEYDNGEEYCRYRQ